MGIESMRIAVIGSGISGMVSAHLLSQEHDIVMYEANDYIGGHTNTVDISVDGVSYPVDTGFIVFNEKTYPNFIKLMRSLGVAWQPSNMSFSVQCSKTGLVFSPSNLNALFVQRKITAIPSSNISLFPWAKPSGRRILSSSESFRHDIW
jgi:predicted NAD/FAD-binding protein